MTAPRSLWVCCLLLVAHLWVHAAPDDAMPPSPAGAAQVLLLLRMPPDHFRPEGAYSGGYGDAAAHAARRRVAAALAREHGLTLATDWPMPLLGVDCYAMAVPPAQSPERVVEDLSRDPRVEWAQVVNVYRTRGHNDPLYPLQPAARVWQLSELHALATGRDVRVAVVDSGIDDRHPDLMGQIALKENFVDRTRDVPEQHGTAVAGIIAARADNGIGIAGVAPQVRLLALRACWEQRDRATLCTSLTLAMALHHAIEHAAAVINLSLSGPSDRLLARLIDVALARRITVVGAIDPVLPDGGFPASHRGVIAVADTADPPLAGGALLAPGRDVPTTLPGGRWGLVSGSSYAAAHVAGLFALLRERMPSGDEPLTAARVLSFPEGEIDACATLARVAGDALCDRTMTRAVPSIVHR
jgi:subtilisin family serine protease